ncbi:MAG: hypothetical protein AB7O74_14460 [Candidatus Nanopelagicales bacterium]
MRRLWGWVLAAATLLLVVAAIAFVLKHAEAERRATADVARVIQVFSVPADGGGFDVLAEVDTGGCDTWGIWAERTDEGYAVLVPDQHPGIAFDDGECEINGGANILIPLYAADDRRDGRPVVVNGKVFTIAAGPALVDVSGT